MIRALLVKLWPVLLPVGFYFLWIALMSRRLGGREHIAEHVRRSLLFWALMTSGVLLICGFLWWGLEQTEPSPRPGRYVPPAVHQGELKPGRVLPDDGG